MVQKKLLCVIQFQFFTCTFQPVTVYLGYRCASCVPYICNALQGCNQTNSQPEANLQPNMYFSCPTCFSCVSQLRTDLVQCYTSYHHINILQENVAPCFDLPKQNTFSLHLFSLPQPNSH